MIKSLNKAHKISLVLLIFLVAFGTLFALRPKGQTLPNIVFITVDALRADHLGCYGYKRRTSPNIDNFAAGGRVFTNCFATSSNTIYSSLGLFTGKYLATDKPDPSFWDNLLDAKFKTLAEYLKGFGYSTFGLIAGNTNYAKGKGFERGFDYFFIIGQRDAETLTKKALQLINLHYKNKPFFIWVHYLDPHIPYPEEPVYLKEFESDALSKENDKLLKLRPESAIINKSANEFSSNGYLPAAALHNGRYSLNYYIACYDAQILYADFHIGKLLERLKDDTLIILTADHGESLGEHNTYFAHGEDIYDEVLHVPLIIKDNRYFKAGKNLSIVSSIDITPTILSRIKPFWYFLNKPKFNGIDLRSAGKWLNPGRKYIYSYFPWAMSIRDVNNNIKFILSESGKKELYILPDENKNLLRDNLIKGSVKKKLMIDLKDWLKNYPVLSDTNARKINLDKDAEGNLKSLGYLQ